MTIDLDALEKLADGIIGGWSKSRTIYEPEAATIKALIAELKEAREHLARCVELVPAPGAIEAADAFLARNGKGDGQ